MTSQARAYWLPEATRNYSDITLQACINEVQIARLHTKDWRPLEITPAAQAWHWLSAFNFLLLCCVGQAVIEQARAQCLGRFRVWSLSRDSDWVLNITWMHTPCLHCRPLVAAWWCHCQSPLPLSGHQLLPLPLAARCCMRGLQRWAVRVGTTECDNKQVSDLEQRC